MNAPPEDQAEAAAVAAADGAWMALRARAAALHVGLHCTCGPDGVEFLATRWGWCRSFSTQAEVEAWLTRMEGTR